MLTTIALAANLYKRGIRSGRAKASSRGDGEEEDAAGVVGVVLMVLLLAVLIMIAVLKYIGTCTIFARANPKFSTGSLVLVFILFLFFGDLYLIYFSVRWGVNGIRALAGKRVIDYRSLPFPRSEAMRAAKNVA